jgi:cyclophilin family peptidyl-prolyl cis-trans isomerase
MINVGKIAGLVLLGVMLFSSFTTPKPKEQKVEISTRYGRIIIKLYNETPLHRDNFIDLVNKGFYDSLLFHRVIPTFMIQGGDPTSKYAPAGKLLGDGDLGYRIPAEINKKFIHKRGALGAARDDNPERASNGSQFYIVQGMVYKPEDLVNMENNKNVNAKRALFEQIMRTDSVRVKMDDFTLRGDKDGMHMFLESLKPKIDSLYAPMEMQYTAQQVTAYATIGGAPHLDMSYTVFGEVIWGMNVVDSIAAQKRDAYDRPLVDLRMKMRLLK